jgi:hypothetical protein
MPLLPGNGQMTVSLPEGDAQRGSKQVLLPCAQGHGVTVKSVALVAVPPGVVT